VYRNALHLHRVQALLEMAQGAVLGEVVEQVLAEAESS
jgi:hypothetical protein